MLHVQCACWVVLCRNVRGVVCVVWCVLYSVWCVVRVLRCGQKIFSLRYLCSLCCALCVCVVCVVCVVWVLCVLSMSCVWYILYGSSLAYKWHLYCEYYIYFI